MDGGEREAGLAIIGTAGEQGIEERLTLLHVIRITRAAA
jgi:hypothetical protein